MHSLSGVATRGDGDANPLADTRRKEAAKRDEGSGQYAVLRGRGALAAITLAKPVAHKRDISKRAGIYTNTVWC